MKVKVLKLEVMYRTASLQYCHSGSATDTTASLPHSAEGAALCISNEANINGLQQGSMSQEQLTSIAAEQILACCTVHHVTQAVFTGQTMEKQQKEKKRKVYAFQRS